MNDMYYNILLFGETGVGKSTFINAMDIYLKYPTLSEALDSKKICCRIPVKFTWQDEDYKDRVLKFGSDSNENPNVDGQSVTKNLKIHNFGYGGKIFRFIDTPGFWDSRGCLADSENAKRIVEFLRYRFPCLHTVCILLKSAANREDLSFRYNVKQMLSLLHKDMLRNIIFVFTHSSGENFHLGSTDTIFRKVLSDVGATLSSGNNRFFVDNKCFMYLLSVYLKIDSRDSEDIYSDCWDRTVTAYMGLLQRIQEFKPQSVNDILYVSDLRMKLEDLLSQELPQIKINIHQHQTRLEELEFTIRQCRETVDRLSPSLYDIIIHKSEGYPYHLICRNKKCEKGDIYGEDGKACCVHCIALSKSWCFVFENYKCKMCGCSVDQHEQMYKPVLEEKEKRKNMVIASFLKQEDYKIAVASQRQHNVLNQLDREMKETEKIESDVEEHVSLLKQCCFVPYSKECIEQIDLEIRTKGSTMELVNFRKKYEGLYKLFAPDKTNLIKMPIHKTGSSHFLDCYQYCYKTNVRK